MAFEAKNITTNYATNMEKAEIQRRDQVLRDYFKGLNWDKNNEYNLTRHLVLNSQELFPNTLSSLTISGKQTQPQS